MKKSYPLTPAANRLMKLVRLSIFSCTFLIAFVSHAQRELLKDINKEPLYAYDPYVALWQSSQQLYFTKATSLYMTRDTAVVLLKEFRYIDRLTIIGAKAYFAADDGIHGMELWVSNGTEAGTKLLKDIIPGEGSGFPRSITMVHADIIYFAAETPAHGRELWKTNGTSAGTMMVKDIFPGSTSSDPQSLASMNNTIFFTANDGQHGYELWSSIGTAEGTMMIKDITTASKVSSSPRQLTNVLGTLYFAADDKVTGVELWRSDGSAAGTYQVKDIRAGSVSSNIEHMINVNGTLMFTANDGTHGDELWKSNGTTATTVLVKDLNPGSGGSNSTNYFGQPMDNFTVINNVLYFTAGQGEDRNFIVRSNGTEAGTVIAAEAYPRGLSAYHPYFTYLNGNIYFLNGDGGDGYGLYRFDYKNIVHLVRPLGVPESYYDDFSPELNKFNSALYLTVYDQASGWKLMKLLTNGQSFIIDESQHVTNGSGPEEFVRAGSYLYFFTTTYDDYLAELWRTDGTPEGTVSLARPGYADHEMEVIADKVFFSIGNALYLTQGSSESPQLVANFSQTEKIYNLTDINGLLYFTTGNEIWKTDGTAAGTLKVRTLNKVLTINNVNGKAFVLNENPSMGLELWRTNSTGMLLVKTIRPGYAPLPDKIRTATIGSWFFFIANDGTHGNEVWRSDGTAFGTVMIGDLNTSDQTFNGVETDIQSITAFQGKIYVSGLTQDGWKLLSASKTGTFTTIASLPQVTYTIVDEYGLYLFALRTPDDPFQQLWEYDYTGSFSYLADVGYGHVSHTYLDRFLYYSTEYSEGPKQITACGIKDIDVGGYASPLATLNGDLIFGGGDQWTGVEPFAYRNLAAISEDCGAGGGATLAAAREESAFTAYPNPYVADFTMNIEGKEGEQADVMVYNTTGYPVETFRGVNVNSDYPNIGATWPKGIYFVKVYRAGKVFTQQVVKK
jgi:ELWxxDGT repeat protein